MDEDEDSGDSSDVEEQTDAKEVGLKITALGSVGTELATLQVSSIVAWLVAWWLIRAYCIVLYCIVLYCDALSVTQRMLSYSIETTRRMFAFHDLTLKFWETESWKRQIPFSVL
jgi:hypothetical protein